MNLKKSDDDPDFSFPFQSQKEEELVPCPICGKEFKNKRGKNIHMGQAHPDVQAFERELL